MSIEIIFILSTAAFIFYGLATVGIVIRDSFTGKINLNRELSIKLQLFSDILLNTTKVKNLEYHQPSLKAIDNHNYYVEAPGLEQEINSIFELLNSETDKSDLVSKIDSEHAKIIESELSTKRELMALHEISLVQKERLLRLRELELELEKIMWDFEQQKDRYYLEKAKTHLALQPEFNRFSLTEQAKIISSVAKGIRQLNETSLKTTLLPPPLLQELTNDK